MPAGQRYLWPFPGPVHRRNEVHDVGSGWKPADGHGTAAEEEEGEHGDTRKASTVVTANAQWKRGGGRSSIPARIESHVVQFQWKLWADSFGPKQQGGCGRVVGDTCAAS